MEIFWLIEYTAERPPVYIATEGELTYQRTKARRYAAKEEAEKAIDALKLADRWEAVRHSM